MHGGAITMGHPTTWIGDLPAARLGDMHLCPMSTGPVPHNGGPVALGAFTVLVAGLPLARQGDLAVCVGPPDSIKLGFEKVLVGSMGGGGFGSMLTALAIAGMTAVARVAGTGYPRAAKVDGKIVTEYSGAITIEGSPHYQATVVSDLDRLRAPQTNGEPSTGRKLIAALDGAGKKTRIRPMPSTGLQYNPSCNPTRSAEDIVGVAQLRADGKPGTGADSTVDYNPSLVLQYTGEDGKTHQMDPHQALGHEMIHSLHQARGEDRIALHDPGGRIENLEEARTIGVFGYQSEEISERQIQLEAGLSPRPDHGSFTSSVYRSTDNTWHARSTPPGIAPTDTPIAAPPDAYRPNH